MCERINVAESAEPLDGTCGFAPFAANMPQPFQLGHRVSVNNALYTQGTLGLGTTAGGCGECLELTTATGATVVMVTDSCAGSGTPGCDGAGTSMVASQTLSTARDVSGWDMASVRGVPCPVTGNVHLVVDPLSQPPFFLRLRFYNHAVGINTVEVRGAGSGVNTNNPWTPFTRSLGNGWDYTGDARNGGTSWQVRVTTGQGEVVEAAQAITFVDDLDVDLGFQVQDRRDMGGSACVWQPTRDVFGDTFGQEGEVRWSLATGTANVVNTSCRTGTGCLQLPFTGPGVVQFHYNNNLPAVLVPTLDLYGRVGSISSNVLRVRLVGVGATCLDVDLPAVSIVWTHVALDLGATCPPGTMVNGLQVTNVSGNGSLFLDDVTIPPI